MRIDIINLQDKVNLDKKEITKRIGSVLNNMGENGTELSISFVTDSYIRKLNRIYRKVDSPTDVLAFSMREGKELPKDSHILGDVVVSVEAALRESKERKISFQQELFLYLVHGILHLLGYNDRNSHDQRIMRAKELELLGAM